MIHEVAGDILPAKAQAIAHGVARNDHFDHGLALALRERGPSMAKDHRHNVHPLVVQYLGDWPIPIYVCTTCQSD